MNVPLDLLYYIRHVEIGDNSEIILTPLDAISIRTIHYFLTQAGFSPGNNTNDDWTSSDSCATVRVVSA
jgi:hypothetical protein